MNDQQETGLEGSCPHPWVRGENTSGGGNRCGLCGTPEPEGGFPEPVGFAEDAQQFGYEGDG